MASSIIHMAVANEINRKLKKDNDKILIGSIAPDLSKQIGETKYHSHFLNNNEYSIPNMDIFLSLYKNHLDDDFVMGYFIHLYTDFLWFKYFIPEIFKDNELSTLNGDIIHCNKNEISYYIYNDYTNLNKDLLDIYQIDTSVFYKDFLVFDNIIKEIPMDKINIIINQCADIVENSKKGSTYIFDINNIVQFISASTNLIYAKIEELIN